MKKFLRALVPLVPLCLIGAGGWMLRPGVGMLLVGALVWFDLSITSKRS